MNRNQTRYTYAAAHATIWARLQAAGWSTNLRLRYPRATTKIGRVVVALHFKPQALHDGWTTGSAPQAKDGRSTGVDIREWAAMDAAAMMAEVSKIVVANVSNALEISHADAAARVGAA